VESIVKKLPLFGVYNPMVVMVETEARRAPITGRWSKWTKIAAPDTIIADNTMI
jgi:hypothetical protein